MAVTHGHGNPNWTRDETIIALDLYFESGVSIPSSSDQRVIEVSELLRALPYHDQAARKPSFRNPDGVSFKLQNLRQIATGKGLGNVSHMDRQVWDELGNQPNEVKRLANLIKAGIEIAASEKDDPDEEFEFTEGRTVTEAHKRRERNPTLRKKLISKRRKVGRLICEICGCIEPEDPLGESIFEAHHILPLAAGEERKTKFCDLALLCANCHRMLHRAISTEKRWIAIPEAQCILPIQDKPNKAIEATY
jgi:5-methylcytosine-specific restriction protein A